MGKTESGCYDLCDQMNNPDIAAAFSKLVSGGKVGYKTVIERKKEPLKCKNCGNILGGEEKFCPECGTRAEKPATPS